MTPLNRPLSRRTQHEYRVIYSSKSSPIVVTLLPGDVMKFRHLRQRSAFTLTIEDVFRYAVRAHAMAEARAKKKGKK